MIPITKFGVLKFMFRSMLYYVAKKLKKQKKNLDYSEIYN